MITAGWIGTGNMGGALARAAAGSGARLLLCNRSPEKAEALARELGAAVCTAAEAAAESDFLFLGVKPQGLPALLTELGDRLRARKTPFVLVSMAAGVTLDTLHALVGGEIPVVRIMPNLPVSMGAGVVLLAADRRTEESSLQALEELLRGAGLLLRLSEDKLDAASAISGCGPAYVYTFLEALAEGGVRIGLPYGQALELAAQTLIGAGRMTLESGKHPARLRNEVCSPGGTTIAGVEALERGAFRAAAMSAVTAAYARTLELSGGKGH